VQASGKAVPDNSSIFPGFLAAGWILLTLFPVFILPDPHWFVRFFSFIFLFSVQSVVENINESVALVTMKIEISPSGTFLEFCLVDYILPLF
tara:strand:- start:216 stop:491 length:276 start_codon:yes stop_codon:yes gene_type:complete